MRWGGGQAGILKVRPDAADCLVVDLSPFSTSLIFFFFEEVALSPMCC